ncbi:GNAT family N-acetyltransferase [Bacillus timonensis]|uniref:Aminoglycoside N(6')-acetyltransferase type 1 n=1 Tax=Bacillus timonensis TaxID=1033734 RepID=A0A4S3PME3_9BACI|nr:aminoglycoside 6'-N-acetyltransferase [Bacillus timonensis]THE10701.1 GNAT family N-acetyltransferase [Bacillus timonensis]
MKIVKATVHDLQVIVSLALQLWPDIDESVFTMEFSELIHDKKAVVFLAKEENEAIGFAQCQLRVDYVEGTETSPVGYLEGIFVKEEYRRKGVAKQLLALCEKWAKSKDCVEFASDVELENNESLKFHLKNGFQEANRIICLTKKL